MVANLAEARSHNVAPDKFLRYSRELRTLKDAASDANMAVARCKKAAKAEGIDMKAWKDLESLSEMDSDEADIRLRHLQLYISWRGLAIGTQLAMFGEQPAAMPSPEAQQEHRDFSASDRGLQAGQTGELRVANPYPPGSSQYVAFDKAWTRGNKAWLAGQAKIAGDLGRNAGVGSEPETVELPNDDAETPAKPARTRTSRERRVAATTNGQDHQPAA